MEENKNIVPETANSKEPKPGTKDALKAENEALKAELEAMKAAKEGAVSSAAAETPEETGPKMVKLRIPRTKKDEEDVFVSVNHYTCIIKRGVEVEVPDFVAEVLQHQEEMLEKIMLFDDANKKAD